jgi:hypothetical protein
MHMALWIVPIVLAVAFFGSGLLKLVRSKDQLVTSGFGWAEDFSPSTIRLIGVADTGATCRNRARDGDGRCGRGAQSA